MSDDYLWDRSGPPDPDVARMERLLAPLGRRERRRGRIAGWIGGLAAAAAVVATVLVARSRTAPGGAGSEWIEPAEERILAIRDLGRVTIAPKSRLRVERMDAEKARLYLERGRIEASISADARPRFFEVQTAAARCVDLGCRYSLSVGDDGVAHVRVETGQVAFEDGRRDVFVPAGASCTAWPGRGSGTPLFDDARPELRAAADAHDRASPAERPALARALLRLVSEPRDTLPAWHLLQSPDPETVRAAESALASIAGRPEAPPPGSALPAPEGGADETSAAAREEWRRHLLLRCW